MILDTHTKQQLILQELQSRQHLDTQIKSLIAEYCEVSDSCYLSREEWQDFCFHKLTNQMSHANNPFVIHLNQLMPQLGFPLGFAHNKVRVYRGLKWKSK